MKISIINIDRQHSSKQFHRKLMKATPIVWDLGPFRGRRWVEGFNYTYSILTQPNSTLTPQEASYFLWTILIFYQYPTGAIFTWSTILWMLFKQWFFSCHSPLSHFWLHNYRQNPVLQCSTTSLLFCSIFTRKNFSLKMKPIVITNY